MTTILWPVLTLLFQGAVAGLIVLAVTKELDARKEKKRFRQYVLLLYGESLQNKQTLSILKTHAKIPRNLYRLSLGESAWQETRLMLTRFSLQELDDISNYYHIIHIINVSLELFASRPVSSIEPILSQAIDYSRIIEELYLSILRDGDADEARDHRKAYLRLRDTIPPSQPSHP